MMADTTTKSFYEQVPLKNHALVLSGNAMDAFLTSERLKCQSEDEFYTLVCSWIFQSGECPSLTEKKEMYLWILPSLRLEYTHPDFLTCVICGCPLADARRQLSYITRRCLYFSSSSSFPPSSPGEERYKNRGVQTDTLSWSITGSIDLQELLQLKEKEASSKRYIGVAGGFPISVTIKHTKEDRLSLKVGIGMPHPDDPPGPLCGAAGRSVAFAHRCSFGTVKRSRRVLAAFSYGVLQGWNDFFAAPWEEVVREGSKFFPNNECKIKVVMKRESYDAEAEARLVKEKGGISQGGGRE
jgi:hypothetical protein